MTPTTARPYLLPPPYTLLLTYSRISPASPHPPPPTYDGPGTAYGQPFLSQENQSSPSHRNPAYLVRPPSLRARGRLPRPSPYPNFARFPPFPLLGGVIAEPGIHLVGIFGVFTPGIFLGHPLQTKRKEDTNLFFPSSFQKGGRGQTAKEVDF